MCGRLAPARNALSGSVAGGADSRGRPSGPWGIGRWDSRLQAGHPDPAVRVGGALSVLVPAILGAAFVFVVLPWASWVVFAFGWVLFPAEASLRSGSATWGAARSTRRRRHS